jgi:hypothetical protein
MSRIRTCILFFLDAIVVYSQSRGYRIGETNGTDRRREDVHALPAASATIVGVKISAEVPKTSLVVPFLSRSPER